MILILVAKNRSMAISTVCIAFLPRNCLYPPADRSKAASWDVPAALPAGPRRKDLRIMVLSQQCKRWQDGISLRL